MSSTFKLTNNDKTSALWQELKKNFEEQLQKHRKRNDLALSHDDTMELRGQIKELKRILNFESTAKAPDAQRE